MKSRLRSIARVALKVALIALATALLLELGLRGVGCHYKAKFWDAYDERRPNRGTQVTVLCLGESTTAGLWLDFEQSYPKQLERLLRDHYGTDRIKVLVPPHLGQNTSQMEARFDRYLASARPAVVILMAGVNNRWSLAESNIGKFLPAGNARTHLFRLRSFTDDLKLVRLFRLIGQDSADRWRAVRKDLEGKPRFSKWPPDNDPLIQSVGNEPFIALWRHDVGGMIERAQAAGSAAILMTYPNYDTPPLEELRSMATERSIPLVENHLDFAELIEQGRAAEFFFDDLRHPNADGYAIVARNAFDAVVATGKLEERLGRAPERPGHGRAAGMGRRIAAPIPSPLRASCRSSGRDPRR